MKSSMAKLPSEIISLNIHFKCNLDRFNVSYFEFVIVAFEAYNKNGVLPYPGSLSDQPNKIIEIFNVLDSLKLEREQRAFEQQQKEQQKAQRKRK
jgi:hypothetical protein